MLLVVDANVVFSGAIWSNDKALKTQFAVEVLSTGEVIKMMDFE